MNVNLKFGDWGEGDPVLIIISSYMESRKNLEVAFSLN